jgi:hypothetical protein
MSCCCILKPYYQSFLQQSNHYVHEYAQSRNKPDISDSQKISMKELYAFLVTVVQMDHDHKPSTKL